MFSRRSASILALILAATAVATGIVGYVVLNTSANEVTIKEINSNPKSFNNSLVRITGYIVNTSCYMFGPKYVLRENSSEIALGGKDGTGKVDLSAYVSFFFDGQNYTQTEDMLMSIEGHVHYIGFVTDAPSYYVEVENAELKTARWDVVALATQQIRVEVEKTSYSIAEPVRFRLFNKNLSHEPIFGGVTNVAFCISNSKGESVFEMGCDITWISNFTISPNEEIEMRNVLPVWNQTTNQEVQVSPEAYTIKIEMDTPGGKVALLLKIAIAAP